MFFQDGTHTTVKDRHNHEARQAEVKAFIERIFYIICPKQFSNAVRDLTDKIEANLEHILVVEQKKIPINQNGVPDMAQYEKVVYGGLGGLGARYQNMKKEEPNNQVEDSFCDKIAAIFGCSSSKTEINLESNTNAPAIDHYRITNTHDPQIPPHPNSSVTIFSGGFTSEKVVMQDYLLNYNKSRRFAEIKGINWKASSSDELKKNVFEVIFKDQIKKFCDDFGISDFYSFINWLIGKLQKKKFDFKLAVQSGLQNVISKILSSLFKGSPLMYLAHIGYLIVKIVFLISKIFWKAYDEAINVGKAQGWMISNFGVFDNKTVNIQGFSLGSLVAYYTASTVKEQEDQQANKVALGDVTLFGSVIDRYEFLKQAEKLIGKDGSIKGRLIIAQSRVDIVLLLQQAAKLARYGSLDYPIGHYGIKMETIVDHFVKKGIVKSYERGDYLCYLREKVKVVSITDLWISHTRYQSNFGSILER